MIADGFAQNAPNLRKRIMISQVIHLIVVLHPKTKMADLTDGIRRIQPGCGVVIHKAYELESDATNLEQVARSEAENP